MHFVFSWILQQLFRFTNLSSWAHFVGEHRQAITAYNSFPDVVKLHKLPQTA